MIAHKNYKPPTKAEQERMDRIKEMGCIVCWLTWCIKSVTCEIHHVVRGNKRLGHWYSLPLCTPHHRIPGDGLWTSIANGRKAFERAHGSEMDLWLKVQHILGLDDTLPKSKILPRRTACVLAVAMLAFNLSGCALAPRTVSIEADHVSHLTQHWPFTSHPTCYGYQSLNLVARWRHGRVYGELSEGAVLNARDGKSYGGLWGPREVFNARIGIVLWRRK